jgi:hypothetical protein
MSSDLMLSLRERSVVESIDVTPRGGDVWSKGGSVFFRLGLDNALSRVLNDTSSSRTTSYFTIQIPAGASRM